jgi:hypothetical protein
MRLRSSSTLALSVCLFAVACGDSNAPVTVHEPVPSTPAALPRLDSHLLHVVPHLGASMRGIGLQQSYRSAATDPPSSHPIAAVSPTGARTIAQKTLLLAATGDEPSYLAAKDTLDRFGVPYTSLIATQQQVTPQLLSDGVSTCYFSSVIFATSGLGYLDTTTGAWASALSAAQWQMIADFEVGCSAREAIWYAWPSADLGLTYVSSFAWTDSVDAKVTNAAFFASLPASATVPIRYAAGYRAALTDGTASSLLDDGAGGVLLALHTGADGRQTLVSTVDQSPYLTHTLTLEYDLVRWVTGGIFVGQKRAYLTSQIDDVFIDDDMWVPGVGDDGSVTFRITGSDLDALVGWKNAFVATLPAGSTFQPVLAFNGEGQTRGAYPDRTLLASALIDNTSFLWLSHTWDHENMDAMSAVDAEAEVEQNIGVAHKRDLNGFNKSELVTPDVSGLDNLAALQGMYSAGVRYVVSNTSITAALDPGNPGVNPSFNVGKANPTLSVIYQVPRHPTNVYYNTSTPDAQADEYNHIYASYYGRNLSYAEMIDADSEFGKFYLLRGDIDPLMFHQPNLANYNAGTGTPAQSLYGDWITAAAGKFLALSRAPIQTLTQRNIAQAMQARGAFNSCGIAATIISTSTGARTLQLHTTGACTVPVTGLSAATLGTVETYLGSPLTSIRMNAGSTRSIALP